jgi:hypothetical protein
MNSQRKRVGIETALNFSTMPAMCATGSINASLTQTGLAESVAHTGRSDRSLPPNNQNTPQQ